MYGSSRIGTNSGLLPRMTIFEIFTNQYDQLDYRMHASFLAVFSAFLTVLLVKRK